MPFATPHANDILVLGDQLVFGTCMLGTEFGVVESASVKRTADKNPVENCVGNLRSFFLKNPRFELVLDTVFDVSVEAPGLLDQISLPDLDILARVTDVTVKWEKGRERMLSIEATHWDALANATAWRYTPTTGIWTPLDPIHLATPDGGFVAMPNGQPLLVPPLPIP